VLSLPMHTELNRKAAELHLRCYSYFCLR
jgi:hypothetical protein